MKPRLLAPILLVTLGLLTAWSAPLQTSFIYQGRLTDGGQPASGSYDLRMLLFAEAEFGFPVGNLVTNVNVRVVDGLFNVEVDFGTDIYDGTAYWLEIGVRHAGSGDAFSTLVPRQRLSPAPYSLFSLRSAISAEATGLAPAVVTGDAIAEGAITRDKVAPDQVVTSLNGLTDDLLLEAGPNLQLDATGNTFTLGAPEVWSLKGNAGTLPGTQFLGTTDAQPLEFRVDGTRALRLVPGENSDSPNIVGGSSLNHIAQDTQGSVIVGGGAAFYAAASSSNTVKSSMASIGGGTGSSIDQRSDGAVVGGGFSHRIDSLAGSSVIGGGSGNHIGSEARVSVVGGGDRNDALTPHSTVGGGRFNEAGGREQGFQIGWSAVLGGDSNWATGSYATIGGGYGNRASGHGSFIGGGGVVFIAEKIASFVANRAEGVSAVVPGGAGNRALGDFSLAAGFKAEAQHNGTFVWADRSSDEFFASTSSNQFLVRAQSGVGINATNPITTLHVDGNFKVGIDELGTIPKLSANLINLHVGQNTNGASNGIAFMENDVGFGMKLGYDGSGQSSNNKLAIYDNADLELVAIENGGNLGLGVTNPRYPIELASGAHVTFGGVWTDSSDRAKKENLQPVDPARILAKILTLPLTRWNFIDEPDQVRHLGPMAQDFHAAFGLGRDDKHIAALDVNGVSLAAIQGLNRKLEEKVAEQQADIDALKRELAELKALLVK